MTFADLGLSDAILKAVTDAGYTEPTPIQANAIPPSLEGRDVLGIAQTGTGKTASFVLPMIHRLAQGRAKARMPRSLILAPTRELAAQVADAFETYGKHHKLTMALLIGGVSFTDQFAKLDRGVDVLIATPGRLLDHFERGKLMLSGVQTLVIDEADRMLDMGFIPDVEKICRLIPFTRQTLFFSATMPPEIQRLTETFLQNPVQVEVAPPSTIAENIVQAICYVSEREKRDALRILIKTHDVKNAIIFCNRKRDVTTVYQSLARHEFNTGCLHGDLDQRIRTQTLDAFRAGKIELLVASDVAARGLDIPDVSHIFNFDVPHSAEDYVHRIGRTGRAGREGHAFTIATRSDAKYVQAIESLVGKTIEETQVTGISRNEKSESDDAQTESRGKGRRGPRRGQRSSSNRESAPRSAPTSAPTSAPAPERHENSPKNRDERPPARRQPNNDTQRNASAERRVVGMGDHVPAFLKTPIPKPTGKPKETENVD
jgi:superfamily II DNA/RNA helicase